MTARFPDRGSIELLTKNEALILFPPPSWPRTFTRTLCEGKPRFSAARASPGYSRLPALVGTVEKYEPASDGERARVQWHAVLALQTSVKSGEYNSTMMLSMIRASAPTHYTSHMPCVEGEWTQDRCSMPMALAEQYAVFSQESPPFFLDSHTAKSGASHLHYMEGHRETRGSLAASITGPAQSPHCSKHSQVFTAQWQWLVTACTVDRLTNIAALCIALAK